MSCKLPLRFRKGPRQDFYSFANEVFLNTHEIPTDKSACSTWEDVSDSCDIDMLRAIEAEEEAKLWARATEVFRIHMS